MAKKPNVTKEKLIKAIEKLEKNPNDKIGILADIGVTGLGAVGAGAVASILGTTTFSVPIIGTTIILATAPVALVAGAALAGGAIVYGGSRLIKSGGFNEGKRRQLLNEYKEKLREIQAKERKGKLGERDKTTFYTSLKELLKHDFISPNEAQQLMQSVENGSIALDEAYKLINQVVSDAQVNCNNKISNQSNCF